MSVQQLENKCRICWGENVDVNWNDVLSQHSGLTYKDCYYKYTRLEYIGESNLSTMLCRNCSKDLEYIDAFIAKAIENDAKLQEMIFHDDIKHNEETKAFVLNSEAICLEEIEIKQEIPNSGLYEIPYENCTLIQEAEDQMDLFPKAVNTIEEVKDNQLNNESKAMLIRGKAIAEPSLDTPNFIALLRQLRKYHAELTDPSSKKTKKSKDVKNKKSRENWKPTAALISTRKSYEKDNLLAKKPETKKTESTPRRLLCQYCSLELKSTYHLKIHEDAHNVDRERTETCPKCGVKFYNKQTLRNHIKTHDANRQKEFKCEFCEKAFFNRGALNVHRRIHLGLMVKCQICSKEFYRNVELYKHMNSHSSTLINVGVKKRSKYFVQCKHCGKKILSTSFKSHTAAHLNQPEVKCSICNKEFFRRESCRYHLRTNHNKKPEELTDFMILYERIRYTHLYIRQNAELEPKED